MNELPPSGNCFQLLVTIYGPGTVNCSAIARPGQQYEGNGQYNYAVFGVNTADVVQWMVKRDELEHSAGHSAQAR